MGPDDLKLFIDATIAGKMQDCHDQLKKELVEFLNGYVDANAKFWNLPECCPKHTNSRYSIINVAPSYTLEILQINLCLGILLFFKGRSEVAMLGVS